MMDNNNYMKGGEFLLQGAEEIFIPEEFNEEQKMIAETCRDFLQTEVFPNLETIDKNEPGTMRSLIVKSGELGLLGISVPEELNGFGQNFVTSMLASEELGAGYSYTVAYSAHTGIGTLPLLYYGSEELKKKYIPRMASGEFAAAYCLTEPNAGSDANSGRSRAVLSEDGKNYILNGQKMWITNGGFADVLTVFAKVDNDKILSAFLVERDFPGVSFNPEEKKMGIKGSSTVQIFFNDCIVPVENMIGNRGEGFRIALNILHVGRIKLGANVLGAAKCSINHAVNYANERKQFGQLIGNFGAIKYKLAEQVIRVFATESATYRLSKYIDQTIEKLVAEGKDKIKVFQESFTEYALEAALLKVLGSETLDYIVDETVQIMGGMGFSAEMPADRAYRDSRINRIFEGTNEINRLVMTDMTLKYAKRADSQLFPKGKEVFDAVMKNDIKAATGEDYFEYRNNLIVNLKKALLLVLERSHNALGKQFSTEQEVMMCISDMIVHMYAAESILLRVKKLEAIKGVEGNKLYKDILDCYLHEACQHVFKFADDALVTFAEGEMYSKLRNALVILTEMKPVNVKEARRRIANKLIEDNKYQF
ncbi:MAG: acyl-CoA dehydrogenase family protein [Bacteroidota bacterium]